METTSAQCNGSSAFQCITLFLFLGCTLQVFGETKRGPFQSRVVSFFCTLQKLPYNPLVSTLVDCNFFLIVNIYYVHLQIFIYGNSFLLCDHLGQGSTHMIMLLQELLNILVWMILLKSDSHLITVTPSYLNPSLSSTEELNIYLTCWFTTIRYYSQVQILINSVTFKVVPVCKVFKISVWLTWASDIMNYFLLLSFLDFWYTILWSTGYPSPRIAMPKNT